MQKVIKHAFRLLTVFSLIALLTGSLGATGRVVGVVRDVAGNPLPDLLVSLASRGLSEALPVLTRTDRQGRLTFQNIEAGLYELSVMSSLYESPQGRFIEVQPGETVSIKLVLEHLLTLGADQENLDIKSLLRTAGSRRMIFRTIPGSIEERPYFFEKAALQLVTDTGLGGDGFSFPGKDLTGTTTSFAVQDSLLGSGDYIVAGRVHSGSDSSWRVKNILDYDLGPNHGLRLYLGYGRVSFGQAAYYGTNLSGAEFIESATATKILSAGVEDRWNLGDALSLLVGFELNQVRHRTTRSFVSPNAQIDFTPFEGTTFQVRLSSKRCSETTGVELPDGDVINLSDAVYLAPSENGLGYGTTRHVEAGVVQSLGAGTKVEVTAFRSQISGAPVPIMAFWEDGSGSEFLPLEDDLAGSRGYRVSLTREFTPQVSASISYVRAEAAGLLPAARIDLVGTRAAFTGQVGERFFHGLATELDAFIPASQTQITALFKATPGGSPLVSLSALSDARDTSDRGVSLFVRQLLPIPQSLFGLMGLDFLASYRLEVLLDIRNLTNEELGLLEGSLGNLVLVQRPRTVRGGIAVKF